MNGAWRDMAQRETEKITLPFTILTTWYYRKKI
jgi:hypothetical protein